MMPAVLLCDIGLLQAWIMLELAVDLQLNMQVYQVLPTQRSDSSYTEEYEQSIIDQRYQH